MAYTETGFKRSMKVARTKTGNDDSVVTTIYDGQDEFIYDGDTYQAIASDDDFRRLERNGVDGDWDVRLAAFKNYVLQEAGADAYAAIDWDTAIENLTQYDVKIMSVEGSSGYDIIAIVYVNDILASTNETVNVLFDLPITKDIPLQIPSINRSGTYSINLQGDEDINSVTNARISPESSINGIYSVTINPELVWAG